MTILSKTQGPETHRQLIDSPPVPSRIPVIDGIIPINDPRVTPDHLLVCDIQFGGTRRGAAVITIFENDNNKLPEKIEASDDCGAFDALTVVKSGILRYSMWVHPHKEFGTSDNNEAAWKQIMLPNCNAAYIYEIVKQKYKRKR